MGKSLELFDERLHDFVEIAFDIKPKKWKGKKNNNYLHYVYTAEIGVGVNFRLEKYFARSDVAVPKHNHYFFTVFTGGEIHFFNGGSFRDLFNYVHNGKFKKSRKIEYNNS